MTVSIVGLGYVGAVTGACLAELGVDVVCVDVDERKVRQVAEGVAPVFEAGLDDLVRRHAGSRLRATTDLPAAVAESDLTMIAVGTPFAGNEIDLDAVREVTRAIGTALRGRSRYHVVVVKLPGSHPNLNLSPSQRMKKTKTYHQSYPALIQYLDLVRDHRHRYCQNPILG